LFRLSPKGSKDAGPRKHGLLVFKGAKPGDLPVEQPTKIELVINHKSIKMLGLAVPPAILSRADDVIE
jgi:putative tryptophan/tyrosine transport system substrate-binding protein